MATLAERIAQEFSSTAPAFDDPEDDVGDGSAAQVVDAQEEDEDDDIPTSGPVPSKLRKKNLMLLADGDRKYAGKTVSRRALDQYSDDDQSMDDEDDSEIDSDGIGDHLSDDLEFVDKSDQTGHVTLEESNSDADRSGADSESDYGDDEYDADLASLLVDKTAPSDESDDEDEDTGGENTQLVSKSNEHEEVQKGKAIQNQIQLWETLLELRIELHKLIQSSNQLPQHNVWDQLTSSTNDNSQLIQQEDLTDVQNSLVELIEAMLTLQNQLNGNHDEDEDRDRRGVKRSIDELEEQVGEIHTSTLTSRNDTIQKWDDRTRFSVNRKNNQPLPQSILEQIDQIMTDKHRLLSRTQHNRSSLKVIGKPKVQLSPAKGKEISGDDQVETKSDKQVEYDPEIFNDDDFYHQLLRELIDQKTNRADGPNTMSKQWMEFQNLRKKIKRAVDTRASKGRKLRYTVMPKLVNFMAPVMKATEWEDEQKDELFSSLFDKKTNYSALAQAGTDVSR